MLPSELKLASLKHCYIVLPEALVSREPSLKPGSAISIRSVQNEDHELYLLWNGQFTSGRFAQLDLCFAQANKFSDELVIISLVKDLELSECSSCRVELVETSDYSILSQHLDANLLDTCKLVHKNLVVPIWLSQNVKVLVKVVDLEPNKLCGLLCTWTQMHFLHSLDEVPSIERVKDDNDSPIVDPVPFISCSLAVDYKPPFVLGHVLICGDRGCGKTHLLKSILGNYKRFHSELFKCKELVGKRPESIKKKFNELLDIALEKQPSILALDDIDSFTSSRARHEEDRGQDAIYSKRLVDVVINVFKRLERIENERRVIILASCRSLNNLDARISEPKGRLFFNKVIKVGNPNHLERIKILKALLAEHKQFNVNLDESQCELIAKRCIAYMPVDLRRLVERSIINVCSRSLFGFNSDPLQIGPEDVMSALKDYTPSNLRGVALQPKSERTFEHVGGMHKVKDALRKTILLQIKHPKLFKRFPMRQQTSILLFGPPGCGKTLIAEALTNEEGINSICVRGPELLSKYIGASESNVRDLFKRAELAKPCVIFFDEFESLVTKRGSDSTGVTDRVVNQFLTLMDGVEKLDSDIFIIAASSRPDMIDQAILRPGRLDKHIYCPPPDVGERFDILRVHSRNIRIENFDSVGRKWSKRLKGFTGADIQSFLYSAQLKALHETLDARESAYGVEGSTSEMSDFEIEVKQAHLEKAFDEMNADVLARAAQMSRQYPASFKSMNRREVSARASLA